MIIFSQGRSALGDRPALFKKGAIMYSIIRMRRLMPACRTRFSYKSIKRMICKTAYKYSASFRIPFDDMQAEANFLFMRAVAKYKASRGTKFSTFLQTILENGLITYGKKQLRYEDAERVTWDHADDPQDILDTQVAPIPNIERMFFLRDLYRSLSESEVRLVEALMKGFADSFTDLRSLALHKFGFTREQFTMCANNIRLFLKEY